MVLLEDWAELQDGIVSTRQTTRTNVQSYPLVEGGDGYILPSNVNHEYVLSGLCCTKRCSPNILHPDGQTTSSTSYHNATMRQHALLSFSGHAIHELSQVLCSNLANELGAQDLVDVQVSRETLGERVLVLTHVSTSLRSAQFINSKTLIPYGRRLGWLKQSLQVRTMLRCIHQ